MRYRIGLVALLAVVAWGLPYGLNLYAMHVADVALVFAVLAIGLGLAMGVAGQVNLAQVAFFGVGSYAVAILTTHYGYGFWPAALLSLVATVVIGLLVGTPALRVQSHYLGIVTLGLAVAFTNWVTNAALAGGASGISGIPVPPLGGVDLSSDYLYWYVEVVVFAAALAFGLFVVRTPLGRRMRAMRDDSLAAGAVGAEVPMLRMAAFGLASVYGGLAGVLYAGLIRYVSPDTFSMTNMFLLLAMVIIGGRQSLVGCVVGALALSLLREALSDASTYAQLGYGVVVVLAVVFAPTGLAGLPARLRSGWRKRRGEGASAAVLGPFRPFPAAPQASAPVGPGPLLEVQQISKRFRGLWALREVSLSVGAGEIRGIVGPNGSGKTTLFNVISGLYRPSGGTVRLGGAPVGGRRPYQLSHAGLARTFQNLRLFNNLTVRENVLVAADRSRTRGIWRYAVWQVGVVRRDRALRARADAMLDQFGLSAFADALPRSLPYGIQRRVEIARAMVSGPRLLLLDEPAAGLNGEEVRQLGEIVRSIRDSGVTVVIIEHNMGLVMSLCERITVLASGEVIAEGGPAEVAATPRVIEAYLGDSAMSKDVPPVIATEVAQ
ncbi:branched-chain amino acid ABC transporter ATP-binding protein/permease [Rugosimonospora africana]|uniref:Metal-dependent hydrolase n=1 Tax=Rugosimonospora africana TaxID=556532 RepID=A0A8J3QUI7_9ACTN|nr:branched-chain amino acid ABC transporter ATP-binding protein/permease [Rugosimonospora africana]GIH15983.1 metal-dependent hydrolase [Rugosimonospora africana]